MFLVDLSWRNASPVRDQLKEEDEGEEEEEAVDEPPPKKTLFPEVVLLKVHVDDFQSLGVNYYSLN